MEKYKAEIIAVLLILLFLWLYASGKLEFMGLKAPVTKKATDPKETPKNE